MTHTFQQIREKSGLLHEISVLNLIFNPEYVSGSRSTSIYFPVTQKMTEIYSQDTVALHFLHKLSSLDALIKNQNRKRVTISTTSHIDYNYTTQELGRVEYEGNLFFGVYVIRGQSTFRAFGDLYTIPDNSGMKWIDYEKLFRSFPDEYMTPEIEKLHADVTRTIVKFNELFHSKVRREIPEVYGQDDRPYGRYRKIDGFGDFMADVGKKIRYFIKMYIMGCNKIVEKYIEELKQLNAISMQTASGASTEPFAEILIGNYVIGNAVVFTGQRTWVGRASEVNKAKAMMTSAGINYDIETEKDPFMRKVYELQDKTIEITKRLNR